MDVVWIDYFYSRSALLVHIHPAAGVVPVRHDYAYLFYTNIVEDLADASSLYLLKPEVKQA